MFLPAVYERRRLKVRLLMLHFVANSGVFLLLPHQNSSHFEDVKIKYRHFTRDYRSDYLRYNLNRQISVVKLLICIILDQPFSDLK